MAFSIWLEDTRSSNNFNLTSISLNSFNIMADDFSLLISDISLNIAFLNSLRPLLYPVISLLIILICPRTKPTVSKNVLDNLFIFFSFSPISTYSLFEAKT
jgi:hypothetical protein